MFYLLARGPKVNKSQNHSLTTSVHTSQVYFCQIHVNFGSPQSLSRHSIHIVTTQCYQFLQCSAKLANQSRQFGWLVLLPQSPLPDRQPASQAVSQPGSQPGRQARKVLSGKDRARSSNTKLFPSMSKHRKCF